MPTFKEVPFDTLYENNLAKKAGGVLVECDPNRTVLKIIEECITVNNTVLSNAELAAWIFRYYVERTKRHMQLVRICAEKLQPYFKFHGMSEQFAWRCENHDKDKFSGNEHMAMYALACPLYTYHNLYDIKQEAKDAYENIEWPKHYALNEHHPEHYMKQPDPAKEEFVISDEELVDFFNKKYCRSPLSGRVPLLLALGEMVADWMAVSLERGGSAREWWLKNKGSRWTFGPKYTEVIESILSHEPDGLVVDMDKLPEPPAMKEQLNESSVLNNATESLEFAPIENFDELNLEYGPEGWFDTVSEKDETHYTIRNFPVMAFFQKLKKEYKTTKLEHLFSSVGIGWFSARNRTITIHKFFVPELLYLLDKFKFSKSLIDTIRATTWVGMKPEQTCAVDMDRIAKNMTCELYPHQEEFIRNYPANKDENKLRGYLLSFDQGLGKTITSIALMEALGKEKIIILCPKNTMYETWVAHIDKFYKKEQTRYIAGGRDTLTPNRRFYIFNYDRIDDVKLFLLQNKLSNLGIIVDESHNFLRTASQRTQLLMDIADVVENTDILLQSGTPLKCTGVEMIPMLHVLDPFFDDEADSTFRRTFGFNTAIANDVLHARLNRMMTRVTKAILDLPAKTEKTLLIKMKTGYKYTVTSITKGIIEFVNARKRYYDQHLREYEEAFDEVVEYLKAWPEFAYSQDFERWLSIIEWLRSANISDARGNAEIVWANQYEKEVIIPALPDDLKKKFLWSRSAVKYVALKIKGEVIGSYLMKLRMQMTSEMLEAADIKTIVDNAMKKTIVFTSYVDTIETAQQYFVANGYKPLCVYGKTASELTSTVARFQEKQEYNPLIASLKMLSTGATLTAANTVIFLNKPWRSIEYQQASDRVHRIGQDTECFIYSLVLDTGKEENLSTRMEDIMNWSGDQFEQIVDKQELVELQRKFGKGLEGLEVSTERVDENYEPPYTEEQMREHGYSEETITKLKNDPVHAWRMKTGIELVHIEPTKTELVRIWKNWQLMSFHMKKDSDAKCKELFGTTNKELYDYLIPQYKVEAPKKGDVKYPKKSSSNEVVSAKTYSESDINSVDDLKGFYKHCSYGLIDFKANKPWKETHKNTTFEDWEKEWRLLSVEQLLKFKCGICYDTAKANDYFLTKWKIDHVNLFAYTKRSAGDDYNDDPTHTFTVYKDTDGKWKWLEGSWGSFKNNDWSESSSDALIKNIGKALANEAGVTNLIGVITSWPKDGVSMNEFYHALKEQAIKKYKYEVKPDVSYSKEAIIAKVEQNILDGKVYHASPLKLDKLSGKKTGSWSGEQGNVFVTPCKALCACFVINKMDVLDVAQQQLGGRIVGVNFGYDIWNWPIDKLRTLPSKVTIELNIRGLKPFSGESTGYIYTIDYEKYKDKTHMFNKNRESDVEFLIEGDVDYLKCEKVTVKWECKSSEDMIRRKGEGKVVSDESLDNIKKITFPPSEIETLKTQTKIITTRVSKDYDTFQKGDLVEVPWGDLFKVTERLEITKIEDHPFYNELTKQQIAYLKKHDKIAVLTLMKQDKSTEGVLGSLFGRVEYKNVFVDFYGPQKETTAILKKTDHDVKAVAVFRTAKELVESLSEFLRRKALDVDDNPSDSLVSNIANNEKRLIVFGTCSIDKTCFKRGNVSLSDKGYSSRLSFMSSRHRELADTYKQYSEKAEVLLSEYKKVSSVKADDIYAKSAKEILAKRCAQLEAQVRNFKDIFTFCIKEYETEVSALKSQHKSSSEGLVSDKTLSNKEADISISKYNESKGELEIIRQCVNLAARSINKKDDGYDMATFEKLVNDKVKGPYWVIRNGNDIIGSVSISPSTVGADKVYKCSAISDFAILEKYQGKGLGKKALLAIIAYIRKTMKNKDIGLGVGENNTRAISLYKSVGFKRICGASWGEGDQKVIGHQMLLEYKESSTEALSPDISKKKKKIIDYICKLCDTMEPSGLNSKRYRGMLEKMTDKEFDQFMHYMKDGKWQLHLVAPNMIVNLKNEDLLKACDLIGLDLFQRVWMHDAVTGKKYLTDNKYMFLQLPIRRQQQFLDEKMSVPDNDRQIDQLTGQVTGDSRACSITNPEIQILAARGLTETLQELVNVRGGNINNYNEFRRALEETGEADLDTLDPNSRTRASVVMGKLIQSMMLDTNL